MHDFRGGGAEKVSILLANGLLEHGCSVEIIVVNNKGPMKEMLSSHVIVSELISNRILTCIPELAKKLKFTNYDLILSHMTHVNIGACIASIIARKSSKLVAVEHNMMDKNYIVEKSISVKIAYKLTGLLYKNCKKVIAVSNGVRDSVLRFTKVDAAKVEVIHNPVVDVDKIVEEKKSLGDKFVHKFFESNTPTFVAIGSLTQQKNFELFILAFAELRKVMPCNGIILGEGPKRIELEKLISSLNISDCFELAGYVSTPYNYLFKADVFVLSSLWEGLPTVVIEAISAGIKVVSTDCPSGPREILEGGKHGVLINYNATAKEFADAMYVALNSTFPDQLDRAKKFTIQSSAEKYTKLVC